MGGSSGREASSPLKKMSMEEVRALKLEKLSLMVKGWETSRGRKENHSPSLPLQGTR